MPAPLSGEAMKRKFRRKKVRHFQQKLVGGHVRLGTLSQRGYGKPEKKKKDP